MRTEPKEFRHPLMSDETKPTFLASSNCNACHLNIMIFVITMKSEFF